MAAGLFYSSKSAVCLLSLILAAGFLTSASLGEGILLDDVNATLSGRADFLFNGTNVADVEYAVYKPGMTFSGGPVFSNEYVYAYQIFVITSRINGLTVGLNGDEDVVNQGNVPDLPSTSPFNYDLPGYSAVWAFSDYSLDAGKKSDLLYYSSPFAPEEHGSSLWRGGSSYSNLVDLPSPSNSTPEPATLTLFGIAGVVLFLFRPARRRSA